MNAKRILLVGAIALFAIAAPTAYAGHWHHRHHTFVSVGFGFYPYGWGYGYYPYGYGYYPYASGYYPYSYGYYPYGYYSYNRPGYGAYNASIVVQVQTRLTRAGYYHGAIDGVMGPRTRYAIRAYERTHGLRVDGAISHQLLATMGLRY